MNTLLDQYVLAVESDNMCPMPLTIAVPLGQVSSRLISYQNESTFHSFFLINPVHRPC